MSDLPRKSQFLIYQAEGGAIKIDVRFEDETVWLTQQLLAELFQTSKQNIGQHLKNIFEEGELTQQAVVKNFFTTAADGKNYSTKFYNLDAIISVGSRTAPTRSPSGKFVAISDPLIETSSRIDMSGGDMA